MSKHWYALATGSADAETLVRVVLEAVRPRTELAEARARDGLAPDAPPTAVEAWSALSARTPRGLDALAARLRRLVGAQVPVRVSATDDEGWAWLVACGAWVDAIDLLVGGQATVGRIHDRGRVAVIEVDDDTGPALGAALGSAVTIERIGDKQVWWRMGR